MNDNVDVVAMRDDAVIPATTGGGGGGARGPRCIQCMVASPKTYADDDVENYDDDDDRKEGNNDKGGTCRVSCQLIVVISCGGVAADGAHRFVVDASS
jgi:hypothetical protein